MAITRGTLQVARRLRRDIGVEVDDTVRTLTSEWVDAWDGLASTWRAAADELVATAVRLERWPYPTEIMRLGDVDRAMRGSITALDKLAERTETVAAEGADRVIQLDVEREARIVASQAPAAEEPGLARTLADRLGQQQVEALREAWALREQDARTDVQLTVQSRIRTDAVNVIAQRTSQQIHSDTIPLSPQAVDSMRRELIRGIDVGSNPREAAARMVAGVEGQFNGGLNRAMVISRTEMLDAYRTTSQQIHMANADVVPGWSWLSELDLRCCPSCWSLHGTVYPVSEPGPQDHQQGRCARLPQLASWAELGITAPEPPSVMVDAQERFLALPRATQLQIMGPGRLQMLDDGLIGWGDLATLRQSTRWRPSYVPTPVRDLRNRTTRGLPPTPRIAPAPGSGLPARAPAPAWSPPRTVTPQQAQAMQERMGGFAAAQGNALREYTAGGAAEMNALLRGTRPATDRDSLTLADIQQAAGAMRPLPEDVLLYRYVAPDALGVDRVEDLASLVGGRLQERGFMSTTVARSGWTDPFEQMAIASQRPVLMEIATPAGTRGAYVDGVSLHPGQYEMVLAPGTTFEVVEVFQRGAHTVVRVRVVP